MGVVPKLKSSCFCCSLKTGSFVTAWLLLVGSSVQTGFYAFLVDHMNPQKMCSYEDIIWYEVDPPEFRDYYPYEDPFFRLYDGYYPLPKKVKPYDQDAVNNIYHDVSNKSYAANTTDGRPGNSNHTAQHAANTTAGQQTNSSYEANTTGRVHTNSSPADSSNSTATDRRHSQKRRRSWNPILRLGFHPRFSKSILRYRRCHRHYLPFDADSGFLDFEVTSPIDKTILYVNIVIWAIMMAGTTVLMAAVYKEWATLVCAWLLWEGLLLTVATAAAVAAAVLMFRTVAVQIGIVTLLNMAIHLGIDIYLMMVVENYRQQLTTTEEDEEEQVIV